MYASTFTRVVRISPLIVCQSLPTKEELDSILSAAGTSWTAPDLIAAVGKVPVDGRFDTSPFEALASKYLITAIPRRYLKKVLCSVADELEAEEYAAFVAFADQGTGSETLDCTAVFAKITAAIFK